MLAVLQTIRILVIIQIFTTIRCQDEFGNQDILRIPYTSNDANINSNTFNTNILRDSNSQVLSSQYQLNDGTNNDEYAQRYSRSKKVYRIKNPFPNDETEKQIDSNAAQDSGTGASNQYASMQYSLPPEEFLQKLRADNQYYQQQHISSPAPNVGYTATPIPQYQYSTISPPNYENNNQPNNPVQLEPKSSLGATYLSSPSPYQYTTVNNFLDNLQSTPSPAPSYLSTPLNNGQYSSQPSSYVSSSSSIFVSNQPNQQSYVSSPYSIIQTGSPDYSNRVSSTIGNNPVGFDNNDYSGRYVLNMQQQYDSVYASTTTTTPSPYIDHVHDSWQNNLNTGINATPKSLQDNVYSQDYTYQRNQQDERIESNSDNLNSETHRISALASANNIYMNYVPPENPVLNNMKVQVRDVDRDTKQPEVYSNGDFGWKLSGKKPLLDIFSDQNQRYSQSNKGSSDGSAISQMNFHMDTGKSYNYNQISKSAPESMEAQEFAQAAAKVHERLKQQQQQQQQHHQQQQQQQQQQHQQQQQQQNFFVNNNNYRENNNFGLNNPAMSYYNNIDKSKNKYSEYSNNNQYFYTQLQNDLVTAPPYYISTPRDNSGDNTVKPPFDHDKALKNIVPIDVSNVVGNSESKVNIENNGQYSQTNYENGQVDQSARHYVRPITESFYKDKNYIYGINVRNKGDEYNSDKYKQHESNIYGKPELNYNPDYLGSRQNVGFLAQTNSKTFQDNLQSSSMQQVGLNRNQNPISDLNNILKFNDIPYKLTQGLPSDALKLHNLNFDQGGIPPSLPIRLNQNVGSHQLDVTTSLLNKLLYNKQPSMNRPDIEGQASGLLSTINGFKVANPYNVDLKLVAEMLKGKPNVDDSHIPSLRDQYNQAGPVKLDLSQLQLLIKNENSNLDSINDGLSTLGGSYLDLYNTRSPYQGVKYSRSQEEEEPMIPIADASNNHPIGAVIEQDETANERDLSDSSDLVQSNDIVHDNFKLIRPKNYYSVPLYIERYRRPIMIGKHGVKHPKSDVDEPYPLLKPPPIKHSRSKRIHIDSKSSWRRRIPKLIRINSEPLFEANSDLDSLDTPVSALLKPPPAIEAKSDTVSDTDSVPSA